MSDLPKAHPEGSLTYGNPPVTWAQRSSADDAERNYLYVNIKAADVARDKATLNITPTNVTFAGDSKKGVRYEVSLDLYAEIDPKNSKVNHSDREVELVLRKKELKEEFWPRLLSTTQKIHFIKTDFDKWVDEDEQHEVAEEDYGNNFGGFEGLGGEGGGLGNIDFSKLGAGLEGMGGAGLGGAEEGESDDDMPELEEADKDAGESAKSSKIQEVS
ncbi:Hsp90 binding co-chaperone (Sba1) [Aspergillus bombycis]|uniref:Hsp90 binding co-chaperone (Sba1) n=1 Tax=Aspergillus bombycis TaxID=109264 RepID=A0A1F8AAR1_9EURO|nr:Hsp90 binding co-chaperone (Sba1) [Aspergillus bombycis]OGM48796.1 Hsp90 binding co-chaperone (Sba1) [Aspergillus bombycis]